jgi:hypothetical protein
VGAWGNGILQDDVADDVRIAFEDALEEGLSAEEAAERALRDSQWALDDWDDGPTSSMALAALQLQHGILTPRIREKAIEAATSEAAIGRWDETDEDCFAHRKQVLRQFKAILGRGSCTPEELELVTYPKEFALW